MIEMKTIDGEVRRDFLVEKTVFGMTYECYFCVTMQNKFCSGLVLIIVWL